VTRRDAPCYDVASSAKQADFGISLPALSADDLPASLYGHSTWRPPYRAKRWRFARNSIWAVQLGDIPKSAYWPWLVVGHSLFLQQMMRRFISPGRLVIQT